MRPFDLVLRYQSGLKTSTTILICKCEPEARSPHILPTSLRDHVEDTSFRDEGQSEQRLKATVRCACPSAVPGTAPGLGGRGGRAPPPPARAGRRLGPHATSSQTSAGTCAPERGVGDTRGHEGGRESSRRLLGRTRPALLSRGTGCGQDDASRVAA